VLSTTSGYTFDTLVKPFTTADLVSDKAHLAWHCPPVLRDRVIDQDVVHPLHDILHLEAVDEIRQLDERHGALDGRYFQVVRSQTLTYDINQTLAEWFQALLVTLPPGGFGRSVDDACGVEQGGDCAEDWGPLRGEARVIE
jgi:hypothetical protein